jgi:hypothetical protein
LLLDYSWPSVERQLALGASVMYSSSDNDEIASVLALVATDSARQETASKNIGSSIGKAPNRERNFAQKMANIRDDYFLADDEVRRDGGIGKRYTEEEFERRFRMPRSDFDEVCVVVSQDSYFRERKDATGKPGAFPIQKVISALRQLCYGLSSDGVEEYTGLSESTSKEALKVFCNVLIHYLGEKYLRRPNAADLKQIESVYRSKGFRGCIGRGILDQLLTADATKADQSEVRYVWRLYVMSLFGFGTHSLVARDHITTSISLTVLLFSQMSLRATFLQLHLLLILTVSTSAGSIISSTESIRDGVDSCHPFVTHLIQKNMNLTTGRKQFGSRWSACLVLYLSVLIYFTSPHGFNTSTP